MKYFSIRYISQLCCSRSENSYQPGDEVWWINLIPFLQGAPYLRFPQTFKWGITVSMAYRKGDWKLHSMPDRLPLLIIFRRSFRKEQYCPQHLERTKNPWLERTGELGGSSYLNLFFWQPTQLAIRHLKFYDRNTTLITRLTFHRNEKHGL